MPVARRIEPTTISSVELAEYVVAYCNKSGQVITHLVLQKILYYIQAWHLCFVKGHPLFDESPEAWANGPVYKSVYKKYKVYKDNPISSKVAADRIVGHCETLLNDLGLTDYQKDFLEAALQHFSPMKPIRLMMMTHTEAPWNDARKGIGEGEASNNEISHVAMQKFYSARLTPRS